MSKNRDYDCVRLDGVKAIQVIEVFTLRGKGVADDPVRPVAKYYSLDGVLLAEYDRFAEEKP